MTDNGYYEQTLKIIGALMTVISSLSIVLLPKISGLFGNGNIEKVKSYMRKSYNFILLISIPMCVGLISTSDILVPWFLGAKYYDCVLLVNAYSTMFIINGLNDITGFQYLVATDRQKIYAFSIVAGTLSNIIINFFLIQNFGAIGAIVSSVISQVIVMGFQMGYILIVTKEFCFSDIFGNSWRYLLASIIMAIVIMSLKKILSVGAVIKLIILVALGMIVYLGLLLVLKDKMILEAIIKLKNNFKDKRK